MNGLVIIGTIFPHKEIHKVTSTKNQKGQTMIVKEYRSSVMDTVVRRGVYIESDHYLVETRITLKLKGNPKKRKGRTMFDTPKLADEETRTRYNIEVRNRFQALEDFEEEDNAEQTNNKMENIYVGAAKVVLGVATRTSKWHGCVVEHGGK